MRIFITLFMVSVAALLLISGGKIVQQIDWQLHEQAFVNDLAKFQLWAMLIGLLTLIVSLRLHPQSITLLGVGKLSTIAITEKWLGINGKTTWRKNGLQLLLFISLATFVFMFLGVKYTNSLHNFSWWFIPYVVLFSLTNSFAEEMIFRFGVIAGLDNHYSKLHILITSAVLFGLPHYYGNPGGIVGVIMSGVLGYILSKATIETKGISIAWVIHFVQDLIIFTAIMMMNIPA